VNIVRKTFQYGEHEVTFETGGIARQATGAVLVSMGQTVVLVTVVGNKKEVEGRDFFPLTVNYQERTYAAGKVPGGYFKREGKPTERETLISRLIDRPIRPLFPEGFKNEVQVIATVVSMDPEVQPDVPAILGAAAALAISGLPFNGPLAAARVGYKDGQYLLNPSSTSSKESDLDLVVAGTREAVLMVESEANMLSEEVMLNAVMFGHEKMQLAIQAIQEFADEAGKSKWGWVPPPADMVLENRVAELSENDIRVAYQLRDKQERYSKLAEIRARVQEGLAAEAETALSSEKIANIIHDIEKRLVRDQILAGQPRIDGRNTTTIRPITIEVGVLPRTHGSAVFTRGETQALVISTLGTERDAQWIDDLEGDRKENFMLHYNFPPFCVGEVGFLGAPKRREIGHGKLAKRAIDAVIPDKDQFPYVLRVVSEITESNGSSSMATVCGTSLSLMDAGVPIKAAVAGIAMGLIKEGDRYAVLTDILGDEDHLGDMDFKVAGTIEGVTALQMDIKINGITREIMEAALEQARQGRLHILGIMTQAIQSPRSEVSLHAPRIISIKIDPEKIRDVIGKGGATIRELTESTHTTIDISDDGVVQIAAINGEDGQEALRRIKALTDDVEPGRVYEGKVIKIVDFGAFVEVLPGKQGLLHISQIAQERVENVHDYISEGDVIKVKVLEVDRQGKMKLSMKECVV